MLLARASLADTAYDYPTNRQDRGRVMEELAAKDAEVGREHVVGRGWILAGLGGGAKGASG